MPDYGVVQEGFREKPNPKVLEAMLARWKEFYPQADEGESAVQVHFFKTLAAELADRGLRFPTSSVWATMNDIYHSAYVLTASDASLDDVVAYRGLKRIPATAATATFVFSGPAGTQIPQNTLVYTEDDFAYSTTAPAVIPPSGKQAVPVSAVVAGVEGNRSEGIPLRTHLQGVAVSNRPETVITHIETAISGWVELEAGSDMGTYQLYNAQEVSYAAAIREIVLRVRNAHSRAMAYYLQVLAVRHSDGVVLGRSAVLQTALAAGEERDLTFTVGWNLLSEGLVRLVLLNMEGSWGSVSFAMNTPRRFPYPLTVDGVETTGALYGRLVSTAGGAITGGTDREDDDSLRSRYLVSQFNFAGSTVEAIRSRVWRIPGVRDVLIPNALVNDTLETSPLGLPPLSIKPVVWGGDPQAICEVIFNTLPVGLRLVGNTARSVGGYIARYEQPREIPISVKIYSLKVREEFPSDGNAQIVQQVVQVLGGYDANGQYWPGSGIACDVSLSLVYAAVHRVQGVESFKVQLSKDGVTFQEQDIPIGLTEVAQTHHSMVKVC